MMKTQFFFAAILMCFGSAALAHASEQGFILLLPTDVYVMAGVASVALTFGLITVLPTAWVRWIFSPFRLIRPRRLSVLIPSLIAFTGLAALVWVGEFGPHDPTRNPLPLAIWSLFWVAFVILQALFGNLWRVVNPWIGPWLLARKMGIKPLARLPVSLGYWPALAVFLAFAAVLLAHPAPADPDGLALMVASYWAFHFVGMLIFGSRWLRRVEGLSVLLGCYARISIFGGGRIGVPGWKTLRQPLPSISLAVFMIAILAVGSFDGFNETFWWMAKIGVNPLEFPGRSEVITENLTGLFIAVPALVVSFGIAVWLGVFLAGEKGRFWQAFMAFAPAILPIALGYHFGHYLPSFLVEIQQVTKVIYSAFGWGEIHVTTGFFNRINTVRVIWLSQAGAVVLGHIVAILLSHMLALRLFINHRKATISHIPLAVFMVAYTVFGLWLLASPRV